MSVKVAIVNAFVDGAEGGNPAGVVLDADLLSNSQKLNIARKVGLSETAFISKSNSADFKLEFFTPEKQIAHCGHATVAAFSYLSQLEMLPNSNTSKETIDGNRSIQIEGKNAYMEQLAPKYTRLENSGMVLESLGISLENTISEPIAINTGNSFIVVGVKDIDALNAIKPNQELIAEISEKYDLIGFYVFTLETNIKGRDASTRMFAPYYGIDEEAATGMAAGPLACFLYDHFKMQKSHFKIEQGYSMPSPSPSCINITLDTDGDVIASLLAGGIGVVSKFEEVEV